MRFWVASVEITITGMDAQHFVRRQPAQKLLAIHDGHVDVRENGIHPFLAQQLQRLLAVGGFKHAESSNPDNSITRRTNARMAGESSTIKTR